MRRIPPWDGSDALPRRVYPGTPDNTAIIRRDSGSALTSPATYPSPLGLTSSVRTQGLAISAFVLGCIASSDTGIVSMSRRHISSRDASDTALAFMLS